MPHTRPTRSREAGEVVCPREVVGLGSREHTQLSSARAQEFETSHLATAFSSVHGVGVLGTYIGKLRSKIIAAAGQVLGSFLFLASWVGRPPQPAPPARLQLQLQVLDNTCHGAPEADGLPCLAAMAKRAACLPRRSGITTYTGRLHSLLA